MNQRKLKIIKHLHFGKESLDQQDLQDIKRQLGVQAGNLKPRYETLLKFSLKLIKFKQLSALVWKSLTGGKVAKELKEALNQRKMTILHYLFDTDTTLADQDMSIVNSITNHGINAGNVNVDYLDLDSLVKSFHAFVPKTFSWIPGQIFIDNTILYKYFLN